MQALGIQLLTGLSRECGAYGDACACMRESARTEGWATFVWLTICNATQPTAVVPMFCLDPMLLLLLQGHQAHCIAAAQWRYCCHGPRGEGVLPWCASRADRQAAVS